MPQQLFAQRINMAIEVEYTCPFGSTCEKVIDGKIKRCVLYLELKICNNITNEERSDFNCAMNWQVILQNETNARVVGVQQATESFRNEMVNQQPMVLGALIKQLEN